MQIEFSPEVVYVPVYNKNKDLPESEQIKVEFTVLEMGELIEIIGITAKAGIRKNSEVDEDSETAGIMIEAARKFLPGHTTIRNFRTTSGDEIDIDLVLKYPKFLQLMVELLGALVENSSPGDEDQKNSNEQSD